MVRASALLNTDRTLCIMLPENASGTRAGVPHLHLNAARTARSCATKRRAIRPQYMPNVWAIADLCVLDALPNATTPADFHKASAHLVVRHTCCGYSSRALGHHPAILRIIRAGAAFTDVSSLLCPLRRP